MSKAISEGQARNLIASFAVDTPWKEINVDLQPFIMLPPKERGEQFADFLRNSCRVNVASVPSFYPEGTFQWKVNNDESICEKVIAVRNLNLFVFEENCEASSDKLFPTNWMMPRGKSFVTGRVQRFGFGHEVRPGHIDKWAEDNNKILASPKVLVDFVIAFSSSVVLDRYMPLVAAGQHYRYHGDQEHIYLCFRKCSAGIELSFIQLNPSVDLWPIDCNFLVLDR